MTLLFEIYHAPFSDGTPRHPLVTVLLKDNALALAEQIIDTNSLLCEVDGMKTFFIVNPREDDIRELFAGLMKELGIVGSIWVEYTITKC